MGSSAFAIPTTIEIIATISIKTMAARTIPLKMDCRPATGVPRVIHPRMNMPITATIAVSIFVAMDAKIKMTNRANTQCAAVRTIGSIFSSVPIQDIGVNTLLLVQTLANAGVAVSALVTS